MFALLLALAQGDGNVARWARENEFDPLVRAAVDSVANQVGAWPIPKEQAFAAVKAVVAAESAFNPSATRGEAQIGDASIGLMQVLLSTARRLGFPGDSGDRTRLTGLYTPGTNIFIGTKYLHSLLRQTGGNLDAAFSAYNGGYRPHLGFGGKRTTSTPRVCLQWKPTAPSTGRTIDRDCALVGSTKPGTYSNQRYVDKCRNYLDYFFVSSPGQRSPAGQSPPSGEPTGSIGGSSQD